MVRLKSRTECPPNGFIFLDAPISPNSIQTWDFNSLVMQVQERRRANPRFQLPTDFNAIANEVDTQNALRMLSIPRADSYVVNDGGGGPAPNRLAPRSLRRLAEVAGGGAKRAVSGVGALRDWLGDGAVPVANEQASGRAAICASCPMNAGGDWTSFFTEPVAALIRNQLSLRDDLNLTTPDDAKLNVCEACGCPLKLKVHVPLNHITAHLSDEVKTKLAAPCWILAEMATP